MMFSDSPLSSSQLTNQAQTALANKLPGYGAIFQNNLACVSQGRAMECSGDGVTAQDSPPPTVAKSENSGLAIVNFKEENGR